MLTLPLAGGVQAAGPTPQTVRDLAYGVVLYDYFGERHFSALGELMRAQQQGRLAHQGEDAEALRAGLLLSYGMPLEATAVVEKLAAGTVTPATRERAWLYLARIRYQRGQLEAAAQALDQVGAHLAPAFAQERALLAGNLAMARGDYAAAVQALRGADRNDLQGLYVRFNLGVALIGAGQEARGAELLDELGVLRDADPERAALRDRANVALGFAAIKAGEAERARNVLERVRLAGPSADRALLGLGWAQDMAGHTREALLPWNELAGRDAGELAALEGRLAVPYALARIGLPGRALQGYGAALAAFRQEDERLDASIAEVRSGRLFDAIVAANPGEEMGWFWRIERLPGLQAPAHFTGMLAAHGFQESLKSLRDLRYLLARNDEWQARLDAFDDVLLARRAAFARRLPLVRLQERQEQVAALAFRRDALAAAQANALADETGAGFADAATQAQARRLSRDRELLAHADSAGPDAAGTPGDERERLRRVGGVLAWNQATDRAGRARTVAREMAALDSSLAQDRSALAALRAAQAQEPARADALRERIGVLRERLHEQRVRLARLAEFQRAEIEARAVAALQDQKLAVAEYANQARLAVAQLYDRGHQEGADDAPAAP
jgi:hypothetical protein